jgi:hypothetical protein
MGLMPKRINRMGQAQMFLGMTNHPDPGVDLLDSSIHFVSLPCIRECFGSRSRLIF